jgi:hypothetical protein
MDDGYHRSPMKDDAVHILGDEGKARHPAGLHRVFFNSRRRCGKGFAAAFKNPDGVYGRGIRALWSRYEKFRHGRLTVGLLHPGIEKGNIDHRNGPGSMDDAGIQNGRFQVPGHGIDGVIGNGDRGNVTGYDEARDLFLLRHDQDMALLLPGHGRKADADREVRQGRRAAVKDRHAGNARGRQGQAMNGLDVLDGQNLVFPDAVVHAAQVEQQQFSHSDIL